MPRVVPGELVLQASPEVVQRADEHGNWSRETYAANHYSTRLNRLSRC